MGQRSAAKWLPLSAQPPAQTRQALRDTKIIREGINRVQSARIVGSRATLLD